MALPINKEMAIFIVNERSIIISSEKVMPELDKAKTGIIRKATQ